MVADNLGVAEAPEEVWRQEAGPTVFAPFSEDTEYFGRPEQQWMLNFRVSGANVEDEVVFEEGVGRFGHATDPEGNRFELWEPSPT